MTKKVKAPIGYHFMVKNNNDFYLMETSGEYSKHTAGGYTSQLSLDVQIKKSHTTTSTSVSASSSTTRTSTRTVSSRRTSTSTSTGY